MGSSKHMERKRRAKRLVMYLMRAYPKPKSELKYIGSFQFVVAVILSAQCTDKRVNELTASLFRKYKTVSDFADANLATFTREISSIPFFRNKAKAIISTAKEIRERYDGTVPRSEAALVALPGIGYKTAHVILGELYEIWEGIATDTHVRRFAKRFDLTDNKDLTKISKDLESLISKSHWKYVNNGFVLYGRHVCSARPHDCAPHPLTKLWPAAAHRWPTTK